MTENIQYYHGDYDYENFTICIQAPTYSELMMHGHSSVTFYELSHKKPLVIKTGISKVHPKENYSKKIGREVSFYRLEEKSYILESVHFKNDCAYYDFVSDCKTLTLRLKIKKNKEKVHLLFVAIYDKILAELGLA
jgi:hypothetical protein